MDTLCLAYRGMAGTGKRTKLLENLKLVASSRNLPFHIQMKTLSFDSGNAATVAKGEQDDDDDSKSDNHTIEYESSLVHIGFDIARMSMQDKNILRPVLTNYGKGSHVLAGDKGCGNRIIVLYHSHLLSSESVLIIQSVLEQNDGDLSIWVTTEMPVTQRIRDWFIEVQVKGDEFKKGVYTDNSSSLVGVDRNFEIYKKKTNENVHSWNDIFHKKLLSWLKNNEPNLTDVTDIKKFVYEILMRNLRMVECVHFLLDVILEMKVLSEEKRLRLLKVLADTEATGGGITLPSYRIPIVWENLFLKLRNAIIDE